MLDSGAHPRVSVYLGEKLLGDSVDRVGLFPFKRKAFGSQYLSKPSLLLVKAEVSSGNCIVTAICPECLGFMASLGSPIYSAHVVTVFTGRGDGLVVCLHKITGSKMSSLLYPNGFKT